MINNVSTSARESRLLQYGGIKQLGEDIKVHIRTDDPIATAGTFVMAPAAFVSKIGNAVADEFSPNPAVPLGEGGMKYIKRDVQSITLNAASAIGNIVTLHPIKAAGNAIKVVFDAGDLILVDPLLDVGSGIFGHQNKTQSSLQQVLTENKDTRLH